MEFFTSHDACPSCKQNIDPNHKSNVINSLTGNVSKYNEVDHQLAEDIKALDVIIADNNKASALIQDLKQKLADELSRKKFLTNSKASIENDITELLNNTSKNLTDLSILEQEIQTVKSLYDQQDKVKQRYDIVQKLLKDDGIKAKIIEQYIPQINFHVNEYLNLLGLPIQFTLDENFDEVIQSRYRDKFKYMIFSEGEKCRIDNALLLTWREIAKAKNTTNTNLLFLDEVFDSSLDANATEEFLNILTNCGPNTNVFIVSHKTDLTSKVRSVIEMEKHGNFSRIKPPATIQGQP